MKEVRSRVTEHKLVYLNFCPVKNVSIFTIELATCMHRSTQDQLLLLGATTTVVSLVPAREFSFLLIISFHCSAKYNVYLEITQTNYD